MKFVFNIFFLSKAETFDWRMATLTKRPANLPDKTYGAPVGYAYFDIFNTGSRCAINYGIHLSFLKKSLDR